MWSSSLRSRPLLSAAVISAATYVYYFADFIRSNHSRHYAHSDKGRESQDLLNSIGNTPLIFLPALSAETGCRIYGKAEYCNPTGRFYMLY